MQRQRTTTLNNIVKILITFKNDMTDIVYTTYKNYYQLVRYADEMSVKGVDILEY